MDALNELDELRQDWVRHLRAANKARRTVAIYDSAAVALVEYVDERGLPDTADEITRKHLEEFLVDLAGRESKKKPGQTVSAAYVSQHYRALQQFFRWLCDVEEEIEHSPFDKMKGPAVPQHRVEVLTEDQIRALLDVCRGGAFKQRRDTALIRMFMDTGARRSEVSNLRLTDLDFTVHTMNVIGKGRRPRTVSFGDKTAEAVRRYMRARSKHPMGPKFDALWLGHLGPLTSDSLRQMLARRAEQAGVPNVHPHKFRHTFAHRWLADGNGETDLMRLAGWRSPQMVAHYAASAAEERAREAHQRARLGDRI